MKSIVLLLALVWTAQAQNRPSPANANQYIAQLGSVPLTSGGALLVPQSVYSSLKEGDTSRVLQFVLTIHMMNECVEQVAGNPPQQRDSYLTEWKYFNGGLCRLKNCFLQAVATSLLSAQSDNPKAGGSADAQDRESARQQAQLLLTVAAKQGCEGGQSGIDPALLQLLQVK